MNDELNTLFPPPVVVEAGGEKIEITPLKVGQLPALAKAIGPLLQEGVGDGDMLALMGTHGDAVIDAVAVAIRKPRDWVAGLELPDLTSLALAAMEVNKDFFTRQVQPAMGRLDQTLRRMGLPGVDLPSPSDSGQPRSPS